MSLIVSPNNIPGKNSNGVRVSFRSLMSLNRFLENLAEF